MYRKKDYNFSAHHYCSHDFFFCLNDGKKNQGAIKFVPHEPFFFFFFTDRSKEAD